VQDSYDQVLRSVVAEEVTRREDGMYLLADGPAELAAADQRHAELRAEVNAEHAGKPIRCRSYHLPAHLPAPFDKWSRENAGDRFIVYPTDQIVRQPNSRP
jgi:hypothetical protein